MANNRMTPRMFLGRQIKRLREAKEMKPDELAKALYVSEGLVRSWETGRRVPQPDHLKLLEEFFDTKGILYEMREELVKNERLPEYMGRWQEIEEQATSLLWYHPLLIPGLLQTADYAREVMLNSGRHIDEVEEQVQARLERQKILAPENDLVFVVIIDEGVLYRPIGGNKIMHDQLVKLQEFAQQPNIMIQIVPMDVGAYPGLAGGFGIATMDGQEYAYVDDALSGDVLERPEEVAIMKRIWATLQVKALQDKQSMELITKAVERWAEEK